MGAEGALLSDLEGVVIVDDVVTTGKSVKDFVDQLKPDGMWIGVAIFSRGQQTDRSQPYIMSIFEYSL